MTKARDLSKIIAVSPPSALDTLDEIAAAINDDSNFSTTITNSISTKWTQDNTKISNWDTAYSWGDHSTAGYLTSETYSSAAELLTAIKTVDGSGSGLDADLWDGNQFSTYLNQAVLTSSEPLFASGSTPSYIRIGDQVTNNNTGGWNKGVHLNANHHGRFRIRTTDHTYGALETYFWADSSVTPSIGIYGDVSTFRFTGSITNLQQADGHTFWHAGNDGSGSGLDADTVDGIQASSFLRSDASDTMSGQLLINNGNANPLELQRSSQVGIEFNDTSVGSRYLGVNSGNLRYGSDLNHANNSLIWHSGNDGSGSGLDADTVDGIQASSFVRNDATNTTATFTDITLDDQIISSGDTNTYMQFHAADQWRVVTGGTERLEVNNTNVTVTGNIVVSGTVDGRDIATDGTKLDGIESGATADMTASEILTAIKTVDGSGSGLDADTLDGYQLSGATSVGSLIFNNKGQTHTTYTNFNTVMTPGANFIQSFTNGPEGSGQFYGFMLGLGSDYSTSTGVASNYAAQMYFKRNASTNANYLYMRSMENGTWNSWLKVTAGYADTAGDADTLDGVQGSSYLRSDASDTFTSLSGTSITIGSGVTLSESSDRADLLEISSSTSGWAGLQIRNTSNEGRWSFMTDGASAGLYDDENGDWHIYMTENAGVKLYYNNVMKVETTSSGISLGDNDITGVNSIQFTDGVNIYGSGNDSYININAADTAFGGIKFYDAGDTVNPAGYIYHDSSGFGLLNSSGTWAVKIDSGSNPNIIYNNGNAEFYVYSTYTYSPGSSRAPIFYDSNNTGYYVNPNSNTNLYGLYIQSFARFSDNVRCNYGSGSDSSHWYDGTNNILYLELESTVNTYRITDQTTATVRFTFARSTGDFTASGNITAYSDERLKDNIQTLDGSKVYAMRGVSFIKDGKAGSGVIAQEIEKVAPELVHDNDEYKSVSYGNITGYLIEAAKDLKKEVELLKAEIADLKQQLETKG